MQSHSREKKNMLSPAALRIAIKHGDVFIERI
jgi:hypothetical protein